MRTAVSLPGEIFVHAERLARRLKKSRSKLYSDAIAEYIARHDPDVFVQKLNDVWDQVDEPRDEFVAAAARRTVERSDW
jgi:metal-responsive CopG/Arc/MetJ family transcriptional regulator